VRPAAAIGARHFRQREDHGARARPLGLSGAARLVGLPAIISRHRDLAGGNPAGSASGSPPGQRIDEHWTQAYRHLPISREIEPARRPGGVHARKSAGAYGTPGWRAFRPDAHGTVTVWAAGASGPAARGWGASGRRCSGWEGPGSGRQGGALAGSPETVCQHSTRAAGLLQGGGEFQEAAERAVAAFLLTTSGRHWTKGSEEPIGHDPSIPVVVLGARHARHGGADRARGDRAAQGRPGGTRARGPGVRLLRDRQLSGGGWNYGNTTVYGVTLDPQIDATGLALTALSDGRRTPRSWRAWTISSERSPRSGRPFRSVGLVGLAAWGRTPPEATVWVGEAALLQSARGGLGASQRSLLALAGAAPGALIRRARLRKHRQPLSVGAAREFLLAAGRTGSALRRGWPDSGLWPPGCRTGGLHRQGRELPGGFSPG